MKNAPFNSLVWGSLRLPPNIHKQSASHLLIIYSVLCCRWLNANSVLVICCGLLAKWLRVRVRVRVRAGPGIVLDVLLFLPLFSSIAISVVNTFVFIGW